MSSFWKIPKEWVQEWGLSGNEAVLLADTMAWPKCSLEERASRIGVTKKTVFNMMERLKKNENTLPLIGVKSTPSNGVKSTPEAVKKVHQSGVKNTPISKEEESGKKKKSPTPPIKDKKGKEEEKKEVTLSNDNVQPPVGAAPIVGEEKKYTLTHRCRLHFEQAYLQKKGEKYYYAAKDAEAVKQILQKIRFLMPEAEKDDEKKLEDNFKYFIDAICTNPNTSAWVIDNLSLPTINSQFNQIYTRLKNGTAKQFTADDMFRIFGSRNITPDILEILT